MTLRNSSRPPVFCPGCSHERITQALDTALGQMGLKGNQIAIVSDIGCSGLFDTFFHTHAMHGLHGRALTYAAGLKMAAPDLHVIVTMGDGGLGIGGAHLLSACRRNLNLSLLILNNFNFGMTGGQFSATTPRDARLSSSFLNQLEQPFDVCKVAAAAGAPFVMRCSGYDKNLPDMIKKALSYKGFSLLDIWGLCTGRYTQKNPLTPKMIEAQIAALPAFTGEIAENARQEYADQYRQIIADAKKVPDPPAIGKAFVPPETGKQEVIILGSAGQRIITAGEILCLAAMGGGMRVSQKNDYPITVLRGHSVSEIILSPDPIHYTGIEKPSLILALAPEGIERAGKMFSRTDEHCLIIQAADTQIPECRGKILRVDFQKLKIKNQDRALAALGILAPAKRGISPEMLEAAVRFRFKSHVQTKALETVKQASAFFSE